jgi:hypothetical protein
MRGHFTRASGQRTQGTFPHWVTSSFSTVPRSLSHLGLSVPAEWRRIITSIPLNVSVCLLETRTRDVTKNKQSDCVNQFHAITWTVDTISCRHQNDCRINESRDHRERTGTRLPWNIQWFSAGGSGIWGIDTLAATHPLTLRRNVYGSCSLFARSHIQTHKWDILIGMVVVLFSPSSQVLGCYLELRHQRFLQCHFKSTVH